MGLPNSLHIGIRESLLPVQRGVTPKWTDREDQREESLRNHDLLLSFTFHQLANLHSANGNDWFANERFSVGEVTWKCVKWVMASTNPPLEGSHDQSCLPEWSHLSKGRW